MKRYFHKLTAMLLAAAIAIPMVPPVTAYADESQTSAGIALVPKVIPVLNDAGQVVSYTYQYDKDAGGTALTGATRTLVIEFTDTTKPVEVNPNDQIIFTYGDAYTSSDNKVNIDKYDAFEYATLVLNTTVEEVHPVPATTGENASPGVQNTDCFRMIKFGRDLTASELAEFISRAQFVAADTVSRRINMVRFDSDDLTNVIYWNGHYYTFVEDNTSDANDGFITTDSVVHIKWSTAKEKAESKTFKGMKGYLATVTSKAENDLIEELIEGLADDASTGSTWLGGRYMGSTEASPYNAPTKGNGWYWVTGPEAGTKFWGGTRAISDSDTTTANYAWGCPVDKDGKSLIAYTEEVSIPVDDKDIVFAYWNRKGYVDTTGREPNNSGGEYALHMWTGSSNPGTWNDYKDDNTSAKGYFIEYGGYPYATTGGTSGDVYQGDGVVKTDEYTIYTATFDLNGGNVNGSTTIPSSYAGVKITKAGDVVTVVAAGKWEKPSYDKTTLKRTDYTFDGNWYTCEKCADKNCDEHGSPAIWNFNNVADQEERTLYAGWTLNPKVTYDDDGNNTNVDRIFVENTTVTINSAGGTGEYTSNFGSDGSYNASGTVSIEDMMAGNTLTLQDPEKAAKGSITDVKYEVFTGWDESGYDANAADPEVTITAKWAVNPVVHYSTDRDEELEGEQPFKPSTLLILLDGGTGTFSWEISNDPDEHYDYSTEADGIEVGLEDNLYLDNPTKENYQFAGWRCEPKGSTWAFTAQWTPAPIVKYSKYNGDTTLATANIETPLKENVEVTINLDGGKGQYTDPSNVTANIVDGMEITLGLNKLLTLADPTKGGAEFAGWELLPATDANKANEVTLTAKWVSNGKVEYLAYDDTTQPPTAKLNVLLSRFPVDTITVDSGSGSYDGTTGSRTVTLPASTYDSTTGEYTVSLPLADPTWEAHTFNGWTRSTDGRTYTAQWLDNKGISYNYFGDDTPRYTITSVPVGKTLVLEDNDGDDTTDITDIAVAVGTTAIKVDDPTRTGWAFTGWIYSEDNGTYTLTAQWIQNTAVNYLHYDGTTQPPAETNRTDDSVERYPKAEITLNLDGGKYNNNTITSIDLTGTTYTLLDATKEGYTFNGWVRSGNTFTAKWLKNATVKYLDVNKYGTSDADKTSTEDFAVTSPVGNVTVKTAGGSYTVSGMAGTFDKDHNAVLPLDPAKEYVVSDATWTGYTFKGWEIDTTNKILTAVWMTNPVVKYGAWSYAFDINTEVTVDPNGGTVTYNFSDSNGDCAAPTTDSSGKITFANLGEKDVLTLSTPVRAGYTFDKWVVTGNTVKAEWKANPAVTYATGVTGPNTTTSTSNTDVLIGDSIKINLNDDAATLNYKVGGTPLTSTTKEFIIPVEEGKAIDLTTPPTTTNASAFLYWKKSADSKTYTAIWDEDKLNEADAVNGGKDGIPDSFQRLVTFKVVGGTWSGGDTADQKKVVTLKVGSNWSAEGTATADLPTIGEPVRGYDTEGAGWNNLNVGDTSTSVVIDSTPSETLVYTYSFHRAGTLTVVCHGPENGDGVITEEDYVKVDSTGVEKLSKIQLVDEKHPGENEWNKTYIIPTDTSGWWDAANNRYVVPTPADDVDNFVFDGWKVETTADGYKLTAQWLKDDINLVDSATTGDNIPDKYQKEITFKVVGGIFDDHDDATEFKEWVTLMANGVWNVGGKATLPIPTDMKPDAGYSANGRWDNDAMNAEGATTVEVQAGDVLTYTFVKRSSSSSTTVKPVEPETPARDPKIPEQLVEEHISYITGYEDGTVRPNNKITRAEVATILYNLLTEEMKAEYSTHENDFTDVHEGMWYNIPISTLVNMMLLSGYDDGTFGPNKYITRAEMAAILARFEVDVPLKDDVAFDDVDSSWAKDQIMLVARRGWINGYPDGTFRPNAHITRAETMAMINNMLHRNPQTLDDLHEDVKYWEDNSKLDEWYYIHVQEATKTHSHDRNEHGFEIRG